MVAVEKDEATEALIAQINKKAAEAGAAFNLRAPVTTTILDHEDKYKNKPLTGTEELIFKGVRQGARGIVFEFLPADAQPYKQVEFPEKKVFQGMSDEFEMALMGWIGHGEDSSDFAQAAAKFRTGFRKAKAIIEAKLEAEAKSTYEDNPLFGAFG